jgi:hypothetical protein
LPIYQSFWRWFPGIPGALDFGPILLKAFVLLAFLQFRAPFWNPIFSPFWACSHLHGGGGTVEGGEDENGVTWRCRGPSWSSKLEVVVGR